MNNNDLKIKTTWKQNNMKWSCHMFSVFFLLFCNAYQIKFTIYFSPSVDS
jgi:hypothetical protein